jgi:hypothetical protein
MAESEPQEEFALLAEQTKEMAQKVEALNASLQKMPDLIGLVENASAAVRQCNSLYANDDLKSRLSGMVGTLGCALD